MFKFKEGSKVLVPRTGGGYSPGTIVAILGDRAAVEFKIGETYRGQDNPYPPDLLGTKAVYLSELKPIPKEEEENE